MPLPAAHAFSLRHMSATLHAYYASIRDAAFTLLLRRHAAADTRAAYFCRQADAASRLLMLPMRCCCFFRAAAMMLLPLPLMPCHAADIFRRYDFADADAARDADDAAAVRCRCRRCYAMPLRQRYC